MCNESSKVQRKKASFFGGKNDLLTGLLTLK